MAATHRVTPDAALRPSRLSTPTRLPPLVGERLGSEFQRHQFSGLLHSAGELLHTP